MKKLTILFMLVLLIGCSKQGVQEQKKETAPPAEKKALSQQTDKEEGDRLADKERKEPLYRVNQGNWLIEPIGKANPKAVLLTIDDAPEKHALEMAKILKKEKASAIFFVNGKFLEKEDNKRMLKEMAQMGFEIGNHTYSHEDLKNLSEEKQKKEILTVNEMVEKITGKRPVFFRAPFGHYTDFSKQVILEEKMIPMNWTYGYDWEKEYQTKESLSDIMVNTPFLINGANVLMHDRQWTKDALNDMVSGIRGKGYEIIDPKTIQTK